MQWRVKLQGRKEPAIVSKLPGNKFHCSCIRCNDGFCDVKCNHVRKALQEGIIIDEFETVLAEAQRKEARKAFEELLKQGAV